MSDALGEIIITRTSLAPGHQVGERTITRRGGRVQILEKEFAVSNSSMAPYSFTTKPDTKTRKSTKGKYTLHALLDGHYGEVACIAAHPLGSHVASGGRDGTHIWNLQEKKLLGSPAGAGDRGVTTALAWMIRPDDTDDGLAFGTDDGYLSIWRRSRKEQDFAEVYCNRLEGGEDGQEIAAIAFDATSGQLAIVHRSEIVHRFVVGPLMRLTVVKSTRIKNHWPQAVAFGQTAARGPEIWSFGGKTNSNIIDAGGKVTVTKTTGVLERGGAAISVKDDAYILDDTSQGVTLYKLSGSERVKTFAVETNERRSRNVCFHDGGKAIVTGSDHGDVYVFDRRTDDGGGSTDDNSWKIGREDRQNGSSSMGEKDACVATGGSTPGQAPPRTLRVASDLCTAVCSFRLAKPAAGRALYRMLPVTSRLYRKHANGWTV
ncbi:hypothetical protein D9758_016104 [Tetrapyrgos nigripes]|uniref:Uncharacterized protein n=1 Tax=Tetrapyrgos nigripes TaxID=182062 RepID=A0A8H5BZP8_9AGAR|nr:hypothetical protein D9758_016104 [Tetrapyrgos nigripes]